VFLLVCYADGKIINQSQRFADVNHCTYISNALNTQAPVPLGITKRTDIDCICKPVDKLK